ncbi:MAG: hypothetical protein HY801_09405 [Candidatus Lindowbacteria bacterium]|nr:hypothetical protein [Candidatus Lindowbacteria bacterium]
MKADTAPTSLEEVIDRALTLLKTEIDQSAVRVVRKFPLRKRLIDADASQLTQVFLNLFLNAMQAMPNGGTLTIKIREDVGLTDGKGPSLSVEVKDTGHGMPASVVDHLFMPFFTTRENGTGLGLAVSHRIIEEHGGSIDVVSEEGKGTTFVVSFRAT